MQPRHTQALQFCAPSPPTSMASRVASGGELQHVREARPEARIAFGGPGKTDHELESNLDSTRSYAKS
jgi:hypothetical protein